MRKLLIPIVFLAGCCVPDYGSVPNLVKVDHIESRSNTAFHTVYGLTDIDGTIYIKNRTALEYLFNFWLTDCDILDHELWHRWQLERFGFMWEVKNSPF